MSGVLPAGLGRRLALGVLLGMVVYAGLLLWADLDGLGAALSDFPPLVALGAAGLSLLNYGVRFLRWEDYRRRIGIRLPRKTSWLVHLAGLSLTVSPGKMGEALKSLLVKDVDGTPIHRSAPIVVAERFTDLLAFLVLLALGGLASRPGLGGLFWGTLFACAALVVLFTSPTAARAIVGASRRLPPLARLAGRIEGALASSRSLLAPRRLLVPTLLATIGWGLECIGFLLVASTYAPEGVSLAFATYAYALAAIAGAVVLVAPGGLGVTEASLGALLAAEYLAAGLPDERAQACAASAVLVIRLCTLWFAVGVGLVALWLFLRSRRAAAPPAP